MEFIRSKRIQLIFFALGGVAGFFYWKFVGCSNGTCTIKSVWYWMTLWGAIVGFLLGDFVNDFLQKRKGKMEDTNAR